jgi:hypothetical protein
MYTICVLLYLLGALSTCPNLDGIPFYLLPIQLLHTCQVLLANLFPNELFLPTLAFIHLAQLCYILCHKVEPFVNYCLLIVSISLVSFHWTD